MSGISYIHKYKSTPKDMKWMDVKIWLLMKWTKKFFNLLSHPLIKKLSTKNTLKSFQTYPFSFSLFRIPILAGPSCHSTPCFCTILLTRGELWKVSLIGQDKKKLPVIKRSLGLTNPGGPRATLCSIFGMVQHHEQRYCQKIHKKFRMHGTK